MGKFKLIMLSEKKKQQINVCTILFHLYKSLENTNKLLVADSILEVVWRRRLGWARQSNYKKA